MTLSILTSNEIGFSAIPISNVITIVQQLNPWFIFLTLGYTANDVMNLIVSYECSFYSEAKHDKFRRDLQARDGLNAFTGFEGNREKRLLYDASGRLLRDQSIDRDRYMTAATFVVFFPAVFLAVHPEYRQKFADKMILTGKVPTFISEIYKRTRRSTCGNSKIIPELMTGLNEKFVDLFPQFRGTIADSTYLLTDKGLQEFCDHLAYIRGHNGNYIPFVDATIRSLPTIESGTQTTFGSLIFSFDASNSYVYVNNNNSYRNGQPDRIHVFDCLLIAPLSTNVKYNSSLRYTHSGYSIPNLSKDELIRYLVMRVLGISLVETASAEPASSNSSTTTAARRTRPQSSAAFASVPTSSTGRRVWLTPSDYQVFRRLARIFRN